MINTKAELLAPVGSMEALFAAVQNGANAVYLGGKLFNARQFASNFDYEELKFAVNYAHLRNVKVYITVNILIDDKEMKETLDYIKFLYEIDVDGIIVQDLGLAYLIKNIFPDLHLHGSTQMTINNLPGAIFLKKFGFNRVVLARETPLEEIKHINDNTDIELEGFVHGALCMSYSGQCLMSSIIGGRSGNRGKCAQPCRMGYSIVDYGKDNTLFSKWDKKHLLSPRDLNTIEDIERIIDSGIMSLKIEGRMKRPEYVATVVKNYRKVLDLGYKTLADMDKKDVEQIFNRGFTKGLMLGDFGRDFMSYNRPDNRGILIGKVVKIDSNYIYIKLYHNVDEGDGIELETVEGNYIGNVLNFSAQKNEIIRNDKIANVSIGSKVYRTSSNKLLEEARKSYRDNNIRYPINMDITISVGKPAELNVEYNGQTFKIQSNYIVEEAKKVALTQDRVIEQLSKLNDTVYYIDSISTIIDNNSFMPVSEINELRRRGIEVIDAMRQNINKRNSISSKDYNEKINRYFKFTRIESQYKKCINISILKKNQFEQLNLNKLDRIYMGFSDGLEESILKAKEQGKEVYLLTDKILYKEGLEKLKEKIKLVENLIDGVSVSNLGTLQFMKDNFNMELHGDIGLNIFNSFTVESLTQAGLKSMTLSPELNIEQIKTICNNGLTNYESIGYGYLPLMITKNCPMSVVKNCTDDLNCELCPYRKGYGLKDRKDVSFYMKRKDGFTTIYNGFPLMVLDDIDQIYNSGVNMIRLDFTFENENIKEIQEIYYNYANMKISKNEVTKFIEKYRNKNNITKGHYFRGVI